MATLEITAFNYENGSEGVVPDNIDSYFTVVGENIFAQVSYNTIEFGTYTGNLRFFFSGILNAAGTNTKKIHDGEVKFIIQDSCKPTDLNFIDH